MFSPPAVAGDQVIVASCSGSVFSLDRSDGAFVWTYDARQDGGRPEFHGTSIVTEDTIVIASDDRRAEGIGHVYALDRRSGEPRWRRKFDVGVMTEMTLVEGVVYFATLREQVVALELSNGKTAWTFKAGEPGERFFATSTPLVTADRVHFGAIDGVLHALDRKTGKPVWQRDLGDRVSTSLVKLGERVLAGTADNRVHLLSLEDGGRVASRDLPGLPFGRPIPTGDVVIVLTTGGIALSIASDLEAIGWKTSVETEWASFRPVLRGGQLLVGADDGRVHAIAVRDGAQLWSQDFDGPVTSLTDAGGERGEFYVGTTKGIVYATDWTFDPSEVEPVKNNP